MATKAQKKLDAMRARAKNASRRIKEEKGRIARTLGAGIGPYAIGKAEAAGYLESVPTLGLPKTLVVAGIAMFVADRSSGVTSDGAEGVALGMIGVAAYQRGAGLEVSGMGGGRVDYDPNPLPEVAGGPALLPGGYDDELDVEGAFEEGFAAEMAELESAGMFDPDDDDEAPLTVHDGA